MTPTIINFKLLGDERGSLIAVEAQKSVPFSIRRIYYIFGTKNGSERGFHAHKTLNQVAVAVAGSFEMILDDGKNQTTIVLDSPHKGILIEPRVWHYMKNFSHDCVLLVMADQIYNEANYIRDYSAFIDYQRSAIE